MIIVDDVYKRYQTDHGPGKWVLKGASFTIPPKTNVGLIGRNGAGKSTLLRIIGGVDNPTRGRVERRCRVSWPMGFGGGLQGSLTGRQNAKFVCRIHGHGDNIPERLAAIQEFAEIGDAFDEPVKTYSSGMKSRLQFALSLAFDFDVYISDEVTSTGDAAFRNKAASAFKKLTNHAGLIMVSHGESTLRQFCSAGIWLHDGHAHWFDDIDDAIKAYRDSLRFEDADVANAVGISHPAARKLRRLRKTIDVLENGISGNPVTVDSRRGKRLIRQAKAAGIVLASEEQIIKRGFRLLENTTPILRQRVLGSDDACTDLYDLRSQCVKTETPIND